MWCEEKERSGIIYHIMFVAAIERVCCDMAFLRYAHGSVEEGYRLGYATSANFGCFVTIQILRNCDTLMLRSRWESLAVQDFFSLCMI
jgi:hypothetical protein